MCGHRLPDFIDIAEAKQRAPLAILMVALHTVEIALYIEHPPLIHQDPPPSEPPTVRLAAKIIDRCASLQRLIEKYDRAVQDAIESDSFMDENIF